MSGRTISAVAAATILVVVAVVFLWPRQPEPDTVEPFASETEQTSVADPVAADATQPSGDKKEDGSPDPRDRKDIPGVSLGVDAGRTSFGCDVDALADKLGSNFTDDESDEVFIEYVKMLSASGDAEHHIAAMQLLEAEGGAVEGVVGSSLPQVDHLALAMQADPLNPLVLWSAANACLEPDLYTFCSDANLQANMRAVLGSNGEYWAQESARLYLMENRDGALDALRRAASAPTFDNYFIEHVRMHQRALSLIPDMGPVERSLGGYALSLTALESSARGLAGCFFETGDPSWFDACTAVANRYASESPTIIQRGLGFEMLAQIYEESGQAEAAALERKRAAELGEFFWVEDEDMVAVMVTDERVLAAYLDELEAGDEVNAARYLHEEIERLKQDPTYTPCPSEEVGN